MQAKHTGHRPRSASAADSVPRHYKTLPGYNDLKVSLQIKRFVGCEHVSFYLVFFELVVAIITVFVTVLLPA